MDFFCCGGCFGGWEVLLLFLVAVFFERFRMFVELFSGGCFLFLEDFFLDVGFVGIGLLFGVAQWSGVVDVSLYGTVLRRLLYGSGYREVV